MLLDRRISEHDETNSDEAPLALRPGMHVHLVGIAGSGISAIAWVLLGRDFVVSGSDLQENALTAALAEAGATVHKGHAPEYVKDADVVVVSSAIPSDNPELQAARKAGIPILKRADLLGRLMAGAKGIAVAGTHGKTTTTSMIAHALLECDRDPSIIVGGVLPGLGRNGRAGRSELFVVEADEYDFMFLGLRPEMAVITNVEHDHPDLFPTPSAYRQAFHRFLQRLPTDGTVVLCVEDGGAQKLRSEFDWGDTNIVTYGLGPSSPDADLKAVDLQPNQLGGTDFVVLRRDSTLGLVRLRVPGDHNVLNALAAIAVCLQAGVPFADLVPALASFGGVVRRFQTIGEERDVTIIDDYAHHPTEIRATLAAARQRYPGRRLWAVWQPHTYSRTRLLMKQFAHSFTKADRVLVLDIYRSRERDTLGIDAAQVAAAMEHPDVRHIAARRDAADYILDRIRPGDVVLTLGAGDGDQVGRWVLGGLRRRLHGDPEEE